MNTPFPLTPALSPGERENCFHPLNKTTAAFCSVIQMNPGSDSGCSLSHWERVRVRGNSVNHFQTKLDRHAACVIGA
jgi:hypothetical protein